MVIELKTEHLFDAHFVVPPPSEFIVMGKGGGGIRFMIPVRSGTFQGLKINGTLRFGADWVLIRNDNTLLIDVRMIIETDDGALIYMVYDGISDLSEEQIKKALMGEFPPVSWNHTTLRFETGHEKYLWLNKVKAAGIGKVVVTDKGTMFVDYSVYALI